MIKKSEYDLLISNLYVTQLHMENVPSARALFSSCCSTTKTIIAEGSPMRASLQQQNNSYKTSCTRQPISNITWGTGCWAISLQRYLKHLMSTPMVSYIMTH